MIALRRRPRTRRTYRGGERHGYLSHPSTQLLHLPHQVMEPGHLFKNVLKDIDNEILLFKFKIIYLI